MPRPIYTLPASDESAMNPCERIVCAQTPSIQDGAYLSIGVTRCMGPVPQRGVCAALEKLEVALRKLEERLEGRDYLADELSLADIAHAGNFVRLRELEERGDTSLVEYPNVAAWMERLEARESYKAAI